MRCPPRKCRQEAKVRRQSNFELVAPLNKVTRSERLRQKHDDLRGLAERHGRRDRQERPELDWRRKNRVDSPAANEAQAGMLRCCAQAKGRLGEVKSNGRRVECPRRA